METVIVRPVKQRGEILFVVIATVLILLLAAVVIGARKKVDPAQKLKYYQLSVFSQLSSTEQGLFMDLYTSAFDIEVYHKDNREEWPDIATLEANLIAPYTRDASWENRGRISWTMKPMDRDNVHRCLYMGQSADTSVTGSFVLFFEHYHTMDGAYFYGINKKQPFMIWYKRGSFTLPADVTEGTLVSSGWKEAVPYRGKEMLEKLNRGK
jgi:hypothetical protein